LYTHHFSEATVVILSRIKLFSLLFSSQASVEFSA
jgi:hypothetical protein